MPNGAEEASEEGNVGRDGVRAQAGGEEGRREARGAGEASEATAAAVRAVAARVQAAGRNDAGDQEGRGGVEGDREHQRGQELGGRRAQPPAAPRAGAMRRRRRMRMRRKGVMTIDDEEEDDDEDEDEDADADEGEDAAAAAVDDDDDDDDDHHHHDAPLQLCCFGAAVSFSGTSEKKG
eukprot:1201552-Rhodomonas_salina.2